VPQGRRIFPASGVRGAPGGMSKTTANIIKKHAMLAGHRMGSDPMFLYRRWLQKLSIKVQVLNTNLVAMCMPYGAYHTRSVTRNEDASVQRCRGVAGADGKPPTASSSEPAGGDWQLVSGGICSS
jgi:hypothetical protein